MLGLLCEVSELLLCSAAEQRIGVLAVAEPSKTLGHGASRFLGQGDGAGSCSALQDVTECQNGLCWTLKLISFHALPQT